MKYRWVSVVKGAINGDNGGREGCQDSTVSFHSLLLRPKYSSDLNSFPLQLNIWPPSNFVRLTSEFNGWETQLEWLLKPVLYAIVDIVCKTYSRILEGPWIYRERNFFASDRIACLTTKDISKGLHMIVAILLNNFCSPENNANMWKGESLRLYSVKSSMIVNPEIWWTIVIETY